MALHVLWSLEFDVVENDGLDGFVGMSGRLPFKPLWKKPRNDRMSTPLLMIYSSWCSCCSLSPGQPGLFFQ